MYTVKSFFVAVYEISAHFIGGKRLQHTYINWKCSPEKGIYQPGHYLRPMGAGALEMPFCVRVDSMWSIPKMDFARPKWRVCVQCIQYSLYIYNFASAIAQISLSCAVGLHICNSHFDFLLRARPSADFPYYIHVWLRKLLEMARSVGFAWKQSIPANFALNGLFFNFQTIIWAEKHRTVSC